MTIIEMFSGRQAGLRVRGSLFGGPRGTSWGCRLQDYLVGKEGSRTPPHRVGRLIKMSPMGDLIHVRSRGLLRQ